jgi:hypothetical protein
MKSTLYLPMLLMFAATAAQAEDKPEQAAKQQAETAAKPDTKLNQAALEKAFSQKLTGAALVGSYTIDGQKSDKAPKEDRYELEKVSKVRDDYWLFLARVKYGETDLKIPITLKVLWAGDTPMISLTDFTIPGLGTFTSRVMFYGDRYAGTWQHGEVGGHMWGKIEPAKKADTAEKKDEPKTDAKSGETK